MNSMNTTQQTLDHIKRLPVRQGPAPRMTPNNPQEQLEQFPSDWGLIEQLGAYAFQLDRVVERPTQIAPPGSRALTLDDHDATADRHAFMVDLEFAHIHNPPIGSMHLTLPQALRDAAIERGWALRHPLAVRGIVSPDVVFVYAPRDATELAAAKSLLEASHAYARGHLTAAARSLDA
jgi:phospholipase/carboxylesterase